MMYLWRIYYEFMMNLWCIYDEFITNLWWTYDVFMMNLWRIYDELMMNLWRTYDELMMNLWWIYEIYDELMRNLWCRPTCQELTRPGECRVMGTTCNIRPIQILNNVLKVRSAKRTHRKSIDRLTDCPTKSIGVPKTPYTVTEYTLSSTRCKYVKWVRYTIKLIVLIEV
jgi:hypothetical protein